MKKKILFLSPLPPPYYGSALSSKEILDFLRKDKDFEVRNIKINFAKDIYEIGRVNLEKLKELKRKRKEIKEIIENFKPNVIYYMPATSKIGLLREFILVREIKRLTNNKILFHIRTRLTDKDWKNPFFRIIYRKIFSNQKAIVLDESLKKDLRDLIKRENIYVLPNAIKNKISKERMEKIIKKRDLKKSINILFLSNMDELKGWFELLKACEILKNKKIDFNCIFVGSWFDKKLEKRFYNFIDKKNLKKQVAYVGRKTGKEKEKILEASDILVFPTKKETFGRVILEAMQYGIPVIANGIGAIPTTIKNGKTGFVLERNSPEEIAEYLETLIKNKKRRIKMGLEGRKRFLKHYTLKIYEKKFKELIRNV